MTNKISLIGRGGSSLSIKAAGKGPVVLFVHGFPLNNDLWANQLEALGGNFHIIAPDLLGFGESSREPEILAGVEISDYARDLELVRNHLSRDQPVVICGLSMGGYVAFEYWSRYASNLRGLVLVNTKPSLDTDAAKSARLSMANEAEQGADVLENMEQKLLGEFSIQSRRDVCDAACRMISETAPATVAAAQRAMARRQDFESRLHEIQFPTLVIGGADDPLASVESTKAWASRIPNSKLEIIPGAGHLTPLETPREFNAALSSFLAELT